MFPRVGGEGELVYVDEASGKLVGIIVKYFGQQEVSKGLF